MRYRHPPRFMNSFTAWRSLLFCLILLSPEVASCKPTQIPPEAVVVLYNTMDEASEDLARYYAKVRAIPGDNLIGLPIPPGDEISREEFQQKIQLPLRQVFDDRQWWIREKGSNGVMRPASLKCRVLVTMLGVPFKIARTPETIPAGQIKKRPFAPDPKGNEASVDSELSLLGIEDYEISGPIPNPYFRKDQSLMDLEKPEFLLVSRIDGPSLKICKRMIEDALAVERTGLWGKAYLDLSRKGKGYEQGDQWLEEIAAMNRTAGIPCVVDRNIDTYVTNYPMSDAALYFGWYSHHRNGPLLNDSFRFKRGAIAIHLHSYSAFELRDPDQRWCGPILARGATATVGNVYEPFLSLTHYFNILHHRLLSGYTVGESSCMALPVLSWQAVLLGDPLYRPFPADLKINLSDPVDRDYKALRHAQSQWGNEEGTLITKLRTYANKANSGTVFEALGLLARADGNEEEANAFFTVAREKYSSEVDQLRQDLHIVDVYREAGNKKTAILLLKKIRENISPIPGQGAVTALLNILDPPAPPPVRLRQKR